jgi:hypothetical protein
MTAIDNPHDEPAPAQATPLSPGDMTFQDWEGIIVDGEFLVRDTALARKLGFSRPRKIRELIEKHMDELLRYGPSPRYKTMVDIGSGARREIDAFRLNERQSLITVRWSSAPGADRVYAEMMDVLLALKRGNITQDATKVLEAIDDAEIRRQQAIAGAVVHARRAKALREEADGLDRLADACRRELPDLTTLAVIARQIGDAPSVRGQIERAKMRGLIRQEGELWFTAAASVQ